MSNAVNEQDHARLQRDYSEIAVLAGGLAHEVRNPLSTIRLNLELLFEDLAESDLPLAHRMQRKLRTIQQECTHLEDILESFLQFSRAGELTLERTDLAELVREFIDFYRPEAEKHHVEISPHLAGGMPPVMLDRVLMRQVLANLVRNAQQAMPQGGTLELQARAAEDRVHLDIIDSGCGMSPATMEKLFQVFFSTKPGGSGLGLPTVRKIVEAHHGTVTCESAPGRGTKFTLSFPVVPE